MNETDEGVGVAIEADGYAAPFNYQAEAQLTCSDKFYGERLDLRGFVESLKAASGWLDNLDKIKKTLFYGKPFAAVYPAETAKSPYLSCNEIPALFGHNGIEVIHSIIGKATEAGELLDLLVSTIEGKKFDETNFKEEIGDGMWYDAIGLNAIGSEISEIQRTNIAKLRARFPNRFTEYDANNRNLSAERKILES